MEVKKLLELFIKEREYQKKVFGKENNELNVASFLNFIEEYLRKAKKSYCSKWESWDDKPEWLIDCKEFKNQDFAPDKSYEYLIKVFVLAGAALELLTDINPEEWRENDEIKEKWKD